MDAKNTLSLFVAMTSNIETTYKACVPIEDVNRETKKCLLKNGRYNFNNKWALEMDETTVVWRNGDRRTQREWKKSTKKYSL